MKHISDSLIQNVQIESMCFNSSFGFIILIYLFAERNTGLFYSYRTCLNFLSLILGYE